MSAESQNVSRRFIFQRMETWEVPIDEAKLKEYVGEGDPQMLDIELIARGLEHRVIEGAHTPDQLAEMLNDDRSRIVADADFRVDVEQRCPKHEHVWFNLRSSLRPPNENPCFMCREEERHAQDN